MPEDPFFCKKKVVIFENIAELIPLANDQHNKSFFFKYQVLRKKITPTFLRCLKNELATVRKVKDFEKKLDRSEFQCKKFIISISKN